MDIVLGLDVKDPVRICERQNQIDLKGPGRKIMNLSIY